MESLLCLKIHLRGSISVPKVVVKSSIKAILLESNKRIEKDLISTIITVVDKKYYNPMKKDLERSSKYDTVSQL